MRIRLLLVTVLFFSLIGLLPLRAQYLEKAYFGALYMGSMTRDYYNFQNDIFPRAGVKTKFPVASGYLYSRLLYDFKKPGAHFWWMKKFSNFEFNLGYLPRPVAMINRPEPVSNAGNFEPPCKSVIPGPALGTMIRINSEGIGNELMFGLYQTNEDFVEFNFGIQQNVNWPIFQKVGISGYHASRGNIKGIALNTEINKLSLMFFSNRDQNDIKTYSGFAHFNVMKNAAAFVCIVHKEEKWQKIEIGAYKNLSGKFAKYLLGLGYDYSEIKPDSINFYLQVWWDK